MTSHTDTTFSFDNITDTHFDIYILYKLFLYLGYKRVAPAKCQSLCRQRFNTLGIKQMFSQSLHESGSTVSFYHVLPMQEISSLVFGSDFLKRVWSVIVTRNWALFALLHISAICLSFQCYHETRYWFWTIAFADMIDLFGDGINGKMITLTELLGPEFFPIYKLFHGCFYSVAGITNVSKICLIILNEAIRNLLSVCVWYFSVYLRITEG